MLVIDEGGEGCTAAEFKDPQKLWDFLHSTDMLKDVTIQGGRDTVHIAFQDEESRQAARDYFGPLWPERVLIMDHCGVIAATIKGDLDVAIAAFEEKFNASELHRKREGDRWHVEFREKNGETSWVFVPVQDGWT